MVNLLQMFLKPCGPFCWRHGLAFLKQMRAQHVFVFIRYEQRVERDAAITHLGFIRRAVQLPIPRRFRGDSL